MGTSHIGLGFRVQRLGAGLCGFTVKGSAVEGCKRLRGSEFELVDLKSMRISQNKGPIYIDAKILYQFKRRLRETTAFCDAATHKRLS